MEDLASKISEILSSEESLKQLGELASMLGLSGEGEIAPTPQKNDDLPFDPSVLIGLFAKLKESTQDDENINFLCALKPLLGEEKRERIDKAIKLIKLLNLWPIIKDSGIIDEGGDFFGLL